MRTSGLCVMLLAATATSASAEDLPSDFANGVMESQAGAADRSSQGVLVAARRLRKGSRTDCADFDFQRRDIRRAPAGALPWPCNLAPGTVALRELMPRDVIRAQDVGIAPDVVGGAVVQLAAISGGVTVLTQGIALSDARTGEPLRVRLSRPARTLKVRVTGPGSAQLMEIPQ